MNVADERSRSLWMDIEVAPAHAAAEGRCARRYRGHWIRVLPGLSTAYELSGQGQKVIVLDRGKIGSGMTARTSAHLSANNDDTFKTMIDRRGEKLAKDYYESQAASITRIETIQSSENIDCDFRRVDGFLFPGPQTEPVRDRGGARGLQESRDAGSTMPRVYPCAATRRRVACAIPIKRPSIPTKYLQGLARCITARGGQLFADTAVIEVEEKDGGVVVTTEAGHTIRAKHAVVATNSPINDRVALHSKQAPYRTYAMALDIAARRAARRALLGHARSLSLRAHAARQGARLSHRRRRRP